jgi:EpsI family protein
MKRLATAVTMAALMFAAAVAGAVLRPSQKAGERGDSPKLENLIPQRFGGWQQQQESVGVVNPQTQQLLDKLYSQTLTRIYADARGYRIMLSLAYGDDQRGELQAHRPEVCYPAQGFALHGNRTATLDTGFGAITVRQLDTSLGARKEPVTYWFTVAGKPVGDKLQHRLIEMRLALSGQVPDGLLFRVSSIDPDPARAYAAHQRFVADLLRELSPTDRQRIAGLVVGS